MPVVVVANPKGGVGKSTLATNLAGYWASQGHAVMLGDADRQQSSRQWLALRPQAARAIGTWDIQSDFVVKPPRGTTHVVIDTPGGLSGWRMGDLFNLADKVLVPLQPSVFDMNATRDFLAELAAKRHTRGVELGVVGMRVNLRTLAAQQLQQFVQELGVPCLGMLRSTQNYVTLAANGLTLFDLPPARAERDLAQWQELTAWLDR